MAPRDACWHYAGIVGTLPRKITLRRLVDMADARAKQRRIETVQLAGMVWSVGSIDIDQFINSGTIENSESSGPVKLSPELEANVQAEMARIRKEHPELPAARSM